MCVSGAMENHHQQLPINGMTGHGDGDDLSIKAQRTCINKKLIPSKMLLMTFYGALGCLMPFITLHMKYIGLTHWQITWTNTILPLTSLVGPPIAGYIADKTEKHKVITIIAMVLSVGFHLGLPFIPRTNTAEFHTPPVQLWCSEAGSSLAVLPCDYTDADSCQHFQGDVPVSSTFRLTNCRDHCSVGTKSFLFDAVLSEGTQTDEDPEQTSELAIPNLEQPSPSVPPHICLIDASAAKNCISMHKENSSFVFESRLVLSSFETVADSNGQSCRFKQKHVLADDRDYVDITCQTERNCHIVCDVEESTNGTKLLQGETCSSSDQSYIFWIYFVLRSIADMFPAILISLLDAMMLIMTSKYGGDFGRQKMFGLVSVGLTAPLVGALVSDPRDAGYGPVFYTYAILMVISIVITYFLPYEYEKKETTGLFKSVLQLFKNKELVILFLIMTTLGAFWSYLEIFFYLYMDELNAPNYLIGLTVTIGILPSVPFLFKSGKIINYCGHHHLLMIAFVMYCIRFAGFAHMTNPWWSLPLEMMELFTLNLLQVTAATLAFNLAPKNLVATAQALVFIAHFTLGRSGGALIGGYLIKIYGMKTVFVLASVLSGVISAIYFITYYILKYTKKQKAQRQSKADKGQNNDMPQRNTNGTVVNGTYKPIPMEERL